MVFDASISTALSNLIMKVVPELFLAELLKMK